MTDVIIVGAGFSGVVAAHTLQANGYNVTVLDKGRSVGGRMATRRIQEGRADTGAQFFTVRTPEFQQIVDEWLAAELVHIWGRGWSDGSLQTPGKDGYPRYVGTDGMNALVKNLAQDLSDVRVNVKVKSIVKQDDGFVLHDEDGQTYNGDALILTPPVPQTLALLDAGNIELEVTDREALERIDYGPCLCGLFVVEGDVFLPEPGAMQNFEMVVYWMADNQRKGITGNRIITVHTGAEYSREYYDDPAEKNLAFLRDALGFYLAPDSKIVEEQLKKWRYSIPLVMHPEDCLSATGFPLVFAGDAFGGRGRVEGAFLSGLAAAKAILSK